MDKSAGQVHHYDQIRSEMADEAKAIATFYKALISEGIHEDLAEKLTIDRHDAMMSTMTWGSEPSFIMFDEDDE